MQCCTAVEVGEIKVNTVLNSDDELDNLFIETDPTLTPARGCKGCFG